MDPVTAAPVAADPEWLICTCCGRSLRDTAEENCSIRKIPYPHDTGYGMCRGCGGDPRANSRTKRLGWAASTFFDTRIDTLAKALSPENRAKFEAMPYDKKLLVIDRMITKGFMI